MGKFNELINKLKKKKKKKKTHTHTNITKIRNKAC